jgi:hypothetical protein
MNINNLMDGGAAAVAAAAAAAAAASASVSVLEQQQAQAQSHPHLQSVAFDQANSPHGSDGSYHSAHRPYGSPPGQLPLPDPSITTSMIMANLPLAGQEMPVPYSKPNAPQPPVKAFPCSTCQKRFARRSDLARHGKCFNAAWQLRTLPYPIYELVLTVVC